MTVQHAQIPQILTKKKRPKRKDSDPVPVLKQGDKVVYGVIRMHMDDSRTCFPSIATIKKYAHCGQQFVIDSINRLVSAGFMTVNKTKLANGKWTNLYGFPETEFDKTFDMFAIEFLKLNLPIHLKEYYMDMQTDMFDKSSGIGKVSHSDITICDKTGWSIKEIEKFDNLLMEMNMLDKIPSGKIDQAGFPIMVREFNLEGLHQAKLWIQSVNNQLIATQNQIEEVTNTVTEQYDKQNAINRSVQRELNLLKNQVAKYEKALRQHNINLNELDNNYEMK